MLLDAVAVAVVVAVVVVVVVAVAVFVMLVMVVMVVVTDVLAVSERIVDVAVLNPMVEPVLDVDPVTMQDL